MRGLSQLRLAKMRTRFDAPPGFDLKPLFMPQLR
jgi:hypothetical protein